MANDGDRKKSSRKKTSSKRIADAVEQAKQAAQTKPEDAAGKPPRAPEVSAAKAARRVPESPTETPESIAAEEAETTHADAMPLLENEPAPAEPPTAEIPEEQRAGRSLSERASCLIGDVQRLAAQYIDASEDLARRILDLQCEATSWAEGTALEPVIKAQNSLSQRIVESSARAARALWRVERSDEARG